MRKIAIIFIITVLLVGIGIAMSSMTSNKKKESQKEVPLKKVDLVKEDEPIPIKDEEKYVDDNTFTVGIYAVRGSNNYKLLTEYYFDWAEGVDIGVFTFMATHDEIPYGSFYSKWWEYWNSYETGDTYKIGYNVRFTDDDGKVIDYNILGPSDMDGVYPYFLNWLYDDVTIPEGTKHSHVETWEVMEKTKYSSIKLWTTEGISKIVSPIELTAFTYKDANDFDSDTGRYRGNSSHTVFINKVE